MMNKLYKVWAIKKKFTLEKEDISFVYLLPETRFLFYHIFL